MALMDDDEDDDDDDDLCDVVVVWKYTDTRGATMGLDGAPKDQQNAPGSWARQNLTDNGLREEDLTMEKEPARHGGNGSTARNGPIR